jgi:hypothetical protein
MHDSQLEITKDNETTTLTIGTGKYHYWRLSSPVKWWPGGTSGTWARQINATKFSRFSYLILSDSKGKSVARLKEQPYTQGEQFEGRLTASWLIFEFDGDLFQVKVRACPPTRKKFQLWESWGGALSYTLFQAECIGFEIRDVSANASALYVYKGVGISFGLPLKRLPKVSAGGSNRGPSNDFEAPGWLLADDFEGDAIMQSGNLGLGTSISKNCFDFAGHVDNFPGYFGHLPDMQTGNTLSLPSVGFSSGSMKLVRKATPFK